MKASRILSVTSPQKRYNNQNQLLGDESRTSPGLHVRGRGSTGTDQSAVAEPLSARETKVVPLGSCGEKRAKAACVENAQPRKLPVARANLRLGDERGTSERWKPLA